jgi:hypothetical protein
MDQPLVNNTYILKKFPGKGGWTYALIPEILQDRHALFGWVRVKGSIDGYEFNAYHLMPNGKGQLMLPVKSEIRKKIGKQASDQVHVILFADNAPIEFPEELIECLKDNPDAYNALGRYTDGEKKSFVEWIYSAKNESTKADRIALMISLFEKGHRLTEIRKQL